MGIKDTSASLLIFPISAPYSIFSLFLSVPPAGLKSHRSSAISTRVRVTDSFKIQIERSLSVHRFGIAHHSAAARGVKLCASVDLQWPRLGPSAITEIQAFKWSGGNIMRERQPQSPQQWWAAIYFQMHLCRGSACTRWDFHQLRHQYHKCGQMMRL